MDAGKRAILFGVVRHLLTAGGAATAVGSEDETTQLVGAIVTVLSFLASAISKLIAARAERARLLEVEANVPPPVAVDPKL